MCNLDSSFSPYPRLSLAHDDMAAFHRLRIVESGLVSLADGANEEGAGTFGVVSVHCDGQVLAVASHLTEPNTMRKPPGDRFGRLDLIIVPPELRGIGAGRVVILCALLHLLHTHGDSLYSISSLAAHGAVAKVLEELGFSGEYREGGDFMHESIALNPGDSARLAGEYARKLDEYLKLLAFRIRQRSNAS